MTSVPRNKAKTQSKPSMTYNKAVKAYHNYGITKQAPHKLKLIKRVYPHSRAGHTITMLQSTS